MVFGSSHALASGSVTVTPGDTLWRIATTHGLTVQELMALNDLVSHTIYPGQTLTVTKSETSTYTIRSGDTLSAIASRNQTTFSRLLELNPSITNPNVIGVGQVIVIPIGEKPQEESPSLPPVPTIEVETIYIVKPGDTFYRIAINHNLSVDMLHAFNRSIANVSPLRVGQEVVIPSQELINLAKIVHLESRGEPIIGQVAVANVVLNRVASPQFPNTVHEVLHQPNQFTPVVNGTFNTAIPQERPIEAARRALSGENHVPEALFFFNPNVSTREFMHSREEVKTIGNHRFVK